LRGRALSAPASPQSQNLPAVPPLRAPPGPEVFLASHPQVSREDIPPDQVFFIGIKLRTFGQTARNATAGTFLAGLVGHLEIECITATAETHHQKLIARLCRLESPRQHHKTLGRPALADLSLIVALLT